MFETILLATDGSSHAERALSCARDLALRDDALVIVVYAFDAVPNYLGEPMKGDLIARHVNEGREIADRAAKELEDAGVEILEPFANPHIVEGWMRGSHFGPLMPVLVAHATPSRFDGPPRVIALGFQIAGGHLVGPRDLFDDPAFDEARRVASSIADHLRRHGPFEPHRLPMEEMEYTTLPQVMERLEGRWEVLPP